jgi:hypothetical protein
MIERKWFLRIAFMCHWISFRATLVVSVSLDNQNVSHCGTEYDLLCPNLVADKQLKCVSEIHFDALAQGHETAANISPLCSKYAVGQLQTHYFQTKNSEELVKKIDKLEFNKPLMCHLLNQTQNMWLNVGSNKNKTKAVEKIDFTLVTQCSMTRLWMLSFICEVNSIFTYVFRLFPSFVCVCVHSLVFFFY